MLIFKYKQMKELQKKDKDKVEQVKQQVQEIQTVFDSRIRPKKNHTLFEINIVEKIIEKVLFDELPIVKWEDAVKGNISTKNKVTKKPNCIYISALNRKNVVKILKRDFKYDSSVHWS
jgi:hypothetical protein